MDYMWGQGMFRLTVFNAQWERGDKSIPRSANEISTEVYKVMRTSYFFVMHLTQLIKAMLISWWADSGFVGEGQE